MGFRDELGQLLLAGFRPQIHTDALLVSVQACEVTVADLTGDLAVRRLYLDHLGAEVGEQHRGVRTGEHDADLEYADARQWSCFHRALIRSFDSSRKRSS